MKRIFSQLAVVVLDLLVVFFSVFHHILSEPNMVKFDKSTVNPSVDLRSNASKKSVCAGMGASNAFYSSRMSTLGDTSLGSSRIGKFIDA